MEEIIKVVDTDVLVASDDESAQTKGAEEAGAGEASAEGKKSYERNASDSRYTEEAEYLQYRSKKMESLNKRDKHMLIYSNINSLNF